MSDIWKQSSGGGHAVLAVLMVLVPAITTIILQRNCKAVFEGFGDHLWKRQLKNPKRLVNE